MNATPKRNGCHNRAAFLDAYPVGTRLKLVAGELVSEPVMQASVGSKDCNYITTTLGQQDAGCVGCKHNWRPHESS